MLVAGHVPVQAPAALWLPLHPVAGSHSSYGGLVLLLAIAAAGAVLAGLVRVFARGGARRTPAWDCGFPDPAPATQYTPGSFAEPIRRVFGTVAFRAAETVEMPPPGDTAPARFAVAMRDPAWEFLFLPVVRAVSFVTGKADVVQYLTIRRYLSFVFVTLVLLLTVLALWL
jgi:hypothetical protein